MKQRYASVRGDRVKQVFESADLKWYNNKINYKKQTQKRSRKKKHTTTEEWSDVYALLSPFVHLIFMAHHKLHI